MKFHEISRICDYFAKTHFSRPGRKSFPSTRNIDGFGAQFRPKVHFGAKSTKIEDFPQISMISLNFAKFRQIALKTVHF